MDDKEAIEREPASAAPAPAPATQAESAPVFVRLERMTKIAGEERQRGLVLQVDRARATELIGRGDARVATEQDRAIAGV